MTVTIPDVMRHVRNHFVSARFDRSWQTIDGKLTPDCVFAPGEWIAVLDGPHAGVWQLNEHGAIPGAQDAEWTGQIFLLAPPAGFVRLCGEIAEWVRAHPDPSLSSERFGEYSRTAAHTHWTRAFSPELAPYMRMYTEVNL